MTGNKKGAIVRLATPEDASVLAELAAQLFHQAYVEAIPAKPLNSYIADNFGPAQQCIELADPQVSTIVAEFEEAPVGYAQLRLNTSPVDARAKVPLELRRIYIDKSCHGLGIGRQLLAKVAEVAADLDHDKIWLGVWEQNSKAIAFYQKMGFVEIGNQAFPMGTEIQNDLVLMGSTAAF